MYTRIHEHPIEKESWEPMAYCTRCGAQNPEDARYCSKCGSPLSVSGVDLQRHIQNFSQEVEQLGRRLDRSFQPRGRRHESWYDRTFGVFGPLISSVIGLLVLLLVIQALITVSGQGVWPMRVANFLKNYIGVLFLLMLLGGYVSYLSRKYHPFRWAAPLIGGIIFYIMLWLVSIILSALSVDLTTPILQTIANQFSILALPLTLLIIGLGYVGLFASQYHHDDHPLPSAPPSPTPVPSTPPVQPPVPAPAAPPVRLYRSGRERILGGVCGGIAEYFNIDPVIIRVVFVIGMVVSFGVLVLGYLLLWILVPRNPNHPW